MSNLSGNLCEQNLSLHVMEMISVVVIKLMVLNVLHLKSWSRIETKKFIPNYMISSSRSLRVNS